MSAYREEFDHPRFLTHLDRLDAWARGERFFPLAVEVSPCACCAPDCGFLHTDGPDDPGLRMPERVLHSLAAELGHLGVRQLTFRGSGDPLLNPGTPAAIAAAKQAGVASVLLVTHGGLLTEPVARSLIPSLQHTDEIRIDASAADPRCDAWGHGSGDAAWHDLHANLSNLVRLRTSQEADFTLSAAVSVDPRHAETLPGTVETIRDLGFDYVTVAPHRKFDAQGDVRLAECLARISELETATFIVHSARRLHEMRDQPDGPAAYGCHGIDFVTHVGADGGVYPCFRHLYRPDFCYGNLDKLSFSEVWNGARRAEVRGRVLNDVPDVADCRDCAQRSLNRTLWEIKHPSRFANFI